MQGAQTPTILIVDDDVAVSRGVAALLEQAGFHTRCAYTAAAARALIELPTDLVVLDIMLPDDSGLQVCRSFRQRTPYLPILMLNARDEIADKVGGLELGADEYVTKPFEPRELLARVRAMLRFAGQRSDTTSLEQPLCCGPIRLWRSQHRVEIGDQPIELTPTEWTLLELLMEHPKQVFGRETLLRRVWGDAFVGDSRAVDMHVQRLRAKLDPHDGAARCLQTVRGFGYRLVPIDGGSAAP